MGDHQYAETEADQRFDVSKKEYNVVNDDEFLFDKAVFKGHVEEINNKVGIKFACDIRNHAWGLKTENFDEVGTGSWKVLAQNEGSTFT